jgi:asparagine synthase (glutamine-hydrolysing)
MRLAEEYHRLPGVLRRNVVEQAVEFLPGSVRNRSRPARIKRFMRAASLPKVERYLQWVSVFNDDLKEQLYSDDFKRQTSQVRVAGLLEPWFAQMNGGGIVDATLLTDTMTYLPNDLLVKVDIASMAVSLEARSPFLDHHVIEFAASLPENYKVRGMTTKYLLKRILHKILPSENLQRPKMGFGVPLGHWFKSSLKPLLHEVLLSEKAANRGMFNAKTVSHMVQEHVESRQDYAHQLWTLLMLELWFQRFID